MAITFKEMTQTNESTLLLVDGLNLAFRWREFDEFTNEYVKVVKSLAKSYKAGNIIIAADQGSSSYRKTIYQEYKQNRKEKYETQTEEEREKFERFFNAWEECLLILEQEFTLIRLQGVEADDIAGYIVRNKPKFNIDQIWLASSDKDWDLLVQDGVSRFSYVTRKETTVDNWHEHHDCERDDYVFLKAIMGDSGDNIKGVQGIGPKRGLELINKYGTVYDIIDQIPISGKQKYIQALNDSKDLLELNMQLVDILTYCEDAINWDNQANTAKIDALFL
jgi:5'-3' exonuclease